MTPQSNIATGTEREALIALIDKASAFVDGCFEPEGQMLAYFLAENPAGKLTFAASRFDGPDSEIAFRLGVPLLLREKGMLRWVFFTEAWTATYQHGQDPARDLPRDRSDRMEIVIFAAEAASGGRLVAERQIFRGAGPARLLPLVYPNVSAGFVMAPKQPEPAQAGSAP